jgi:hypothetical protein
VYQVYATVTKKYPRPIPTPIEELRPAEQTCEQYRFAAPIYGSAGFAIEKEQGSPKQNPAFSQPRRLIISV